MTLLALLLAAAPHTVAVDLTALDRASYQELDAVTLERTVVVRLVQEGFAVVAASAPPEVLIRLTRSGRAVTLSVGGRSARVELEPRRLREFHLEVAQKASELARAAAAELRVPEPPPPVEPPKPEPPEVEPPPAPPPEPSRPWQVLAGAGALLRAPGVDPRVALGARFAATQSVGFHLELGLAPLPGARFSAYDGSLLLGAGLELSSGTFRLELGVSLGGMLHVFSFAEPAAQEPLGSRVDFLARPFVRAAVNPVGGLLIWAQVGAGLSSHAREHRFLGELLYARGALWLDLTLGIGWETQRR